mgnify:CR=1 FL=1
MIDCEIEWHGHVQEEVPDLLVLLVQEMRVMLRVQRHCPERGKLIGRGIQICLTYFNYYRFKRA